MEILNKTRGFALSSDASFASSFFSRARGLILSRPRDLVLVSPKEDIASSSIHMFLMSYPIDVAWVDKDMLVVDIKPRIRPFNLFKPSSWRIYRPRKPAKYVIELGCGSLQGTIIGDLLEFVG